MRVLFAGIVDEFGPEVECFNRFLILLQIGLFFVFFCSSFSIISIVLYLLYDANHTEDSLNLFPKNQSFLLLILEVFVDLKLVEMLEEFSDVLFLQNKLLIFLEIVQCVGSVG